MGNPDDKPDEMMSVEIIDPIIGEYAERIRAGESGEVRRTLSQLRPKYVEFYRSRINSKLEDPKWEKYRSALQLLLIYLN